MRRCSRWGDVAGGGCSRWGGCRKQSPGSVAGGGGGGRGGM